MRSGIATFAVGNPIVRPRRSPVTTGPAHLVGPPEHVVGRREPALHQCTPDRRRRHGAVVAGVLALEPDEVVSDHVEAERAALLSEQRDVPLTPVAEVEVLPHHHQPGAQTVGQHLVDELARRLGRPPLVEVDDDGVIDPRRREQLELLVEIGQQPRRGGRTNHLGGMAVERDDGRVEVGGGGSRPEVVDDGTMAEVDAVVRADAHRAAARAVEREVVIVVDLHGRASRLPSDQHDGGFGPAVAMRFVVREEGAVGVEDRPRSVTRHPEPIRFEHRPDPDRVGDVGVHVDAAQPPCRLLDGEQLDLTRAGARRRA